MYKVKLVDFENSEDVYPDTNISGESGVITDYLESIRKHFDDNFGKCFFLYYNNTNYLVKVKTECLETLYEYTDILAYIIE